ncbi:MAG: hypothetical protein ACXVXP_00095 [Mycobacteriaceae bacterium]
MSKPVSIFADPERLAIDYLVDQSTYDVDSRPPQSTLATGVTHVQVTLDGTPTSSLVREAATVRVTVWGDPNARTSVKAIASELRGVLVARAGDLDASSVQPLVGRSAVAADPDTKNLSCWFTVRVNLRAQALA